MRKTPSNGVSVMQVYIGLSSVVMVTRLKVTLTSEHQTSHFTVRHLQIDDLTSSGTSRVVIQLQFTSWPHHGVPEHSLPLLQVRSTISFTFSYILCRALIMTCLTDHCPPLPHVKADIRFTSTSWPHYGIPDHCYTFTTGKTRHSFLFHLLASLWHT